MARQNTGARFIKLDDQGVALDEQDLRQVNAVCVFDTQTTLVWEIKTADGLRAGRNTYSWYNPDARTNGGASGYRDGGFCPASCDTDAYITAVNSSGLCGYHNWRLPTREELRSLVNYSTRSPQPSINVQFFPNTVRQFYWSSTPQADNADSAWGIGFTFGYDYAYFKSDVGCVRAVANYIH